MELTISSWSGSSDEDPARQVSQRRTQRERIALKVGERFQLVPSDDIIYASLVDDVITVVAGGLTGTSNVELSHSR